MDGFIENYIELANAVLIKAIEDYENGINYILKNKNHKGLTKKYYESEKYINEVESFFNSNNAEFYTTGNVNPRVLFEQYKRTNLDKITEVKSIIKQNNELLCKKKERKPRNDSK